MPRTKPRPQKNLSSKGPGSTSPDATRALGSTSRALCWGALTSGAILFISFSCVGTKQVQKPPVGPPAPPEPALFAAKVPQKKPEPPATAAEAIRRRDFARAALLLDASNEQERAKPEVRYARALVALELGDIETSLRQVDGLGEKFPLFENEADDVRRRAAERSQDVTLLSHFLGRSREPEDLLHLAEAHAANENWVEARRYADQALKSIDRAQRKHRLRLSARAHELRAESLLAEDQKSQAAKEYRWLATEAASLDESARYDESLSKLDPTFSLSDEERITRAKSFSEAGWVDRTEQELSKLKSKPPKSKEDEDALLAWAVYVSRTDYLRASQLFALAAERGGADRQKHLYYEAKALARSHEDRRAIDKYELVAGLSGPYTDHASFQAARLRFIDGQWKAAVGAYEKYLERFGGAAKHRSDARYDLPIARLAASDFGPAIPELRSLIQGESSTRNRARLFQLLGVALLGAGKTDEAIAEFERVIEYRPLSLPALLAEARLRALGRKPPPPLLPTPPALKPKAMTPLSPELPEKVWRLQRVGLDAEAEQALIQEESQVRRSYPGRSGEALCKLYQQLNSAQRQYQVAQSAASWDTLRFEPEPLTSWQWNCIYPAPYRELVRDEGALREVEGAFVYAVMRQESAFRPTVVSPAHAVGLMQIIPPTAKRIAAEIGEDYSSDRMRAPSVNIQFGTYYLRRLLNMFGGRKELVVAAYNAGPHALTRWLRKGEDLPLDIFVARIPYSETRNYVYRVMGNYARYAYLEGGGKIPRFDLELPKGLKAPADAY